MTEGIRGDWMSVRTQWDITDPPTVGRVVCDCPVCGRFVASWAEGGYFPPNVFSPCPDCGYDPHLKNPRSEG